ncbi:FAD-dependent monooxygenase [Bradyrhizobium sp. U87765 SZCCT0131]|uniref:FAD binding domain-containing protein n=1 Tax=unclassified Bradyrhizobium TaxID=2631580 RepID=UPI001BA817A3|nr:MULTISPECIES: FAD-dependent monooxygenase [unclassified Bradyrhizobium]MBR1221346.1 FAD-dependent monooxygenase [Bradyrhizobium sp. U87765 SZCCT0131]MBR1264731.1 FAD-dependent monooxygenase [Bradyrhizobium sp. U87765 SZCCT0134]MBR1304363.1 FAD-dependent monooxygenase [Bradyrhizobium sp. U87765 SZCCT0110]MBR1322780.1 FAD-dependent monooxygenase [Bradyrhizobium sp. U87765 SZCCT0109]MBR1346292.1 FAD-dependent monooxygenase [Bradyrhizobium sp. U87765 SZCCT0048]
MSAARRPKALIAGGSVGGLFIGNMLVRQGWDVDIVERAAAGLAARGAGIAGHAELTAVLDAIGIDTARPVGIEVSGRVAFDRHGNERARFDYPQYLTSWSLIFNLLRAAFPPERYRVGVEVLDVVPDGARAVARLSTGETVTADLVVAADGMRSRIRGALAPAIQPVYAGYVAWRGVIDEMKLSPRFLAETFERYSFCFPPGGQFIGYPLAGADGSVARGRRRYNFLWYRHVPEGAALDRLLTDDSGHRHDHGIPPPLIRSTEIAQLRRDAGRDLPPSFVEVVLRADQSLLQPIYDLESRQMAFGTVALVGDAAFVCRPHVGIGVLKAAQDAAALAAALREAGSVTDALRQYDAARRPPCVEAVAFGRHLGDFITRGLPDPGAVGLSYDDIIRDSARLPRAEALRRRVMEEGIAS